MSDLIGSIGLETGDIERGLSRIAEKMGRLARDTEGFNQLASAAAAAVAIWAKNFIDAANRAEQFATALQKINTAASTGSAFKSDGGLVSQLKEVDTLLDKLQQKTSASDVVYQKIRKALGLGDADKEEAAALNTLLKLRADILDEIAQNEKSRTEILSLQSRNLDEAAKLEKTRLEYAEKIQAAYLAGNNELAKTLKEQEAITEQMIKQAGLSKDRSMERGTRDWDAEGEVQDKKFQEEEQDRKNAENKLRRSFDQRGDEEDAEINRKKMEEAQSQRDLESAEYQKWLSNQDAKKRAFKGENKELQGELTVTDLARRGNLTKAREEKVAQDYDRKIRDAIRSGNTEGEALLRKQANAAQASSDVEDSKKTAGQRSAERAAGRALVRDEKKADDQNKDLDERLARGAKGDKDSRLEQRREENARNANRQAGQEDARKGKDDSNDGPYGREDRNFLREIRDSLKNKD